MENQFKFKELIMILKLKLFEKHEMWSVGTNNNSKLSPWFTLQCFTFREAERKKSKRNFPGNCLEDNTMNNMKRLYVDTVPCKQSKPEMQEPRAPVKWFDSSVVFPCGSVQQ